MPQPYRLAFGSCSHPALPQPLWPIISSRKPSAFIWGGDAIYADRYAGLNWTAVGLHRASEGGWTITFPPPSVHLDATPDIIRGWYEKQLEVEGYRQFLQGFDVNVTSNDDGIGMETIHSKPIIFGTIDDHDYGQNNGDFTYQFRKESNLAFIDFLFDDITQDSKECALQEANEKDSCGSTVNGDNSRHQKGGRSKISDPMYQRSLDGKGVYGVQLFDFSRKINVDDGNSVLGGGHWVPVSDAMIDPDVIDGASTNDTIVNYSTTHSVAVFALDVRSNKTPWPKGKQHGHSSSALDFLGAEQWKWFRSALANSRARVNIIVSGTQVHTDRFPNDGNVVEEWSKFPESRDMLYDVILNSGVRSPLLISGDVHMSQFLRKDCVRSTDVQKWNDDKRANADPPKRSLIEVTTSGMTHSWGTSFSSQPKHHTWPLWPYSYLVSRTFMTICHYVCPWNEIIIRKMGQEEAMVGRGDGLTGKQYYLGLNFAELEFDFNQEEDSTSDSGAVTVRVFGRKENEPPKLEARWTFDELSGATSLPGMTAKVEEFVSLGQGSSDWICLPYRGLPSAFHYYAAIAIQFVVFCSLFFLPYIVAMGAFVMGRRIWRSVSD
eukprot:scaffold12351_cov141-Skeletonema_menzelii.AAC.2